MKIISSVSRLPWLLLLLLWSCSMARADEQVFESLIRNDGACPVVNMFPYTIGHGRWPATAHQFLTFGWAASAQLAMDHFNARDFQSVTKLGLQESNFMKDCTVYFPPPTVLDSGMEGASAVKALWQASTEVQIQMATATMDSTTNAGVTIEFDMMTNSTTTGSNITSTSNTVFTPFCAVLGPMEPRPVEEVAAITSSLALPHLMYYSESSRFWSDGQDGNSVGMTLSPNRRAHIMLEWFVQRQRDYVAVLHFGKDGSSDLAEELEDLGNFPPYDLTIHRFLRSPGRKNVPILMSNLQQSAITTILLNFDNPRSLQSLADGLANENLLTDDYLFIISPDALPTDQRLQDVYSEKYELSSNMDKLLTGALVFEVLDPFRQVGANSSIQEHGRYFQGEDPFYQAWQSLDGDFVDRINRQHPLQPTNEAYYQASHNVFQTHKPPNLASFVYDSIMAMGIGACKTQQQQQQEQKQRQEVEAMSNKESMIPNLHNISFHGASGPYSPFPHDEAYRNAAADLKVGLYNIQGSTGVNNTRTYTSVLVAIWSGDTGWQDVPGAPVIFKDGTTNPPPTLSQMEFNYLSKTVRILGFVILAICWTVALGGMVAVRWLRRSDAILRAQPTFLYLICFGSFITGGAILTLSFDEQSGLSQSQLSVMCSATLWLFFLGHGIIFMALFSKLWRVDRVLQFRRNNAVSVRQVLGPLIVVLAITLLLLILWTALDPWTWERIWISRLPPETYGECQCDNFWAFFAPLMAILIGAECLAAFFAIRTSDVPEEFSDSGTVILAIGLHVQSWIIGMPILAVLKDSSADATYLGRILVVWVFSTSSVVVVLGPKMYRALRVDCRDSSLLHSRLSIETPSINQDGRPSKHRVRVSGITLANPEQEASAEALAFKKTSPSRPKCSTEEISSGLSNANKESRTEETSLVSSRRADSSSPSTNDELHSRELQEEEPNKRDN